MVYGTPTMYVDLIKEQRQVQADVSSVEMSITAGATSPPSIYSDMRSVLNRGNVKVKGIYNLDCRHNEYVHSNFKRFAPRLVME